MGRGAKLVLPAAGVGAAAARALRRQPAVRASAGPLQRGAVADRGRAGGRLVQPRHRQLGSARAVGAEPDDLRLGGCAPELPDGARVRAGPRRHRHVLADHPASDGQGHSAPARDRLAGDAAGRRVRAAAGPLRARLLQLRRPEDEQDARQRARPVRGDREPGCRRAALLPAARGAVGPGRGRHLGGAAPPLRQRAGERPGEPGFADDCDGRPLSRRGRAGGQERARAGRRPGRRPAGRDRPDRSAGGDLGPRTGGQPVRRGTGAVGAAPSPTTRPTRPGWTRPCTRSPTPSGRWPSCSGRSFPRPPSASWTPSATPARSAGSGPAWGCWKLARRSPSRRRSSRGSSSPRDRHARAPGHVRGGRGRSCRRRRGRPA